MTDVPTGPRLSMFKHKIVISRHTTSPHLTPEQFYSAPTELFGKKIHHI